MKKLLYLFFLATLTNGLLTNCNEEDIFCPKTSSNGDDYTLILKDKTPLQLIESYISQKCVTRGNDDTTIETYELQGETVMYVANYPNGGFDVFSASLDYPMILASSEEGSLHLSDSTELPDGLLDFLLPTSSDTISYPADRYPDISWLWGSFPMIVVNTPVNYNHHVSELELGKGRWVTDTIAFSITKHNVPHIVTDHWSQGSPYNSYIKYIEYPGGIWDHGFVGCGPLAIGEYLHHWYKRTGWGPAFYATATYNPDTNEYVFSNPSSSIWGAMDDNIDSIATVLGYISKPVCHRVDSTGSACHENVMESFLRNQCGLTVSETSFDMDYVKQSILSHFPVITVASGRNNGASTRHVFLIDGYSEKDIELALRHRWVGTDAAGNPTNTFTDSGIPTSYRYIEYDLIQYAQDVSIQMNWGWGNSWYDRIWFNATGTWELNPNNYYNSSKRIFNIQLPN